jgi:DNA ligase-1
LYIEALYNAFYELKETSSRLGKEEIMRRYEDDVTFKETLKFLVDPMVVTGISTKKMQKYLRVGYYETEPTDYDILDLLQFVKNNNTGRDSDIAYVQYYINKLSDAGYVQDFIGQIITKSFKPGVDVKTCQKVYGKDFIPTLNVMLGTSIENCTIPEGAWISISQKLNGNRCFYYKGKLYTRQGKEYTGCQHILDDINVINKTFEREMVFDGELILDEIGLSDSEAFQKGTGIANSKDKDKSNLKLVIFDLLPVDEFEAGKSSLTYKQRRYWINNVLKCRIYNHTLRNITTVDMFYEGYDHSEISKWLEYAEERDMEGIMVNLDAPYQGKRTKDLIKVKKFYTYDLKVVAVEEGEGKNAGRLGAVVVDFKGNEVRVGSGFSDELRDSIWKNPNSIIGKIIEVKYKEVTKNKDTGAESLQFPVFIGIRKDKEEESYE